MISHSRANRPIVDPASVKIIGIGGAGANLIERVALEGMDAAGLLLLSADARVLGACVAPEKIQLGESLLKGLGAGGDPELGEKALLEAEPALRRSIEGHEFVFICVGLGGGTGSGAAPTVARIAREAGAFVVVIATMPFAFEGKRRREQADDALAKLSAHASALITFDNNRMGETVLAKQGAHDAFAATDQLIGESIRAITRIVTRPGLIHLGLDDLISALGDAVSPCLFGLGLAEGKDRSSAALRKAIASPLLDQGALLKDAQTVLVHACGGEDLTLLEIELLMQGLQKFVREDAHLLFGAGIDPSLGGALSLTLISSLPDGSFLPSVRELPAAREEPAEKTFPEPAAKPQAQPEEAPLFAATPSTEKKAPEPESFSALSSTAAEPSGLELFESAPAAPPQQEVEPIAPPAPELEPAAAPKRAKKPTEPGSDAQKVKLSVKATGTQSELSLDSVPRGRFEGENPNVFEGEDLDLPPFLRKKK
jgi:cell division protein FtsZ